MYDESPIHISPIPSIFEDVSSPSLHGSGEFNIYKKGDGYTHFISLLFAVLKRYNSLRELVIGMLFEADKLQHLGLNYMIKRSTLADANT